MNEITRGMKSRTIRSILRKKIDAWLDSIEDQSVRALAASEARAGLGIQHAPFDQTVAAVQLKNHYATSG